MDDESRSGINLAAPSGEEVVNTAALLGDTALDVMINSGGLDGVPIFGAVLGLIRAGNEVKDVIFSRKVARFLNEWNRHSESQRHRFLGSLRDEGLLDDFGETVLALLDRADNARKPELVARIFCASAAGRFDYGAAVRLATILDRCIFGDLRFLGQLKNGVRIDSDIAHALFAAGLLSNGGIDGGGVDQIAAPGEIIYHVNRYGEILLDLLLEN